MALAAVLPPIVIFVEFTIMSVFVGLQYSVVDCRVSAQHRNRAIQL